MKGFGFVVVLFVFVKIYQRMGGYIEVRLSEVSEFGSFGKGVV